MAAQKQTPPITIMLVDDHHVVRHGCKLVLECEKDLVVVAEAGNGREAIEQYRIHTPSIVVMDISMPVMGGIPASKHLMRMNPPPKIIAMSMCKHPQILLSILRAGAHVHVPKHSPPGALTAAIRKVYHNSDNILRNSLSPQARAK
jgi:DNA-binding NarL/FixJ family response regulator